jgi:hypothetical protein
MLFTRNPGDHSELLCFGTGPLRGGSQGLFLYARRARGAGTILAERSEAVHCGRAGAPKAEPEGRSSAQVPRALRIAEAQERS